ncbi:fluoride efflux transporter CrcB [Denitrificimonas sp. JX-1]|uniref:Fluoride-specific ion channel FluC n=1 Tax=Denitrificimonas halotolerans TaxID=3098930 RepID=A0ABU5GRS7_9GAMM|nr:fluoride efflux transporter CrcB [Denitrificimonas sp. JX-1]MDY7219569.1 fluoride efflux transporter CrcB [Denitrificimonas sp. JX-1]
MSDLVVVALGGALGSVLRYFVGLAVATIWPTQLHIATLFVNIVGCFLIGCVFAWFIGRPGASEVLKLLLMTGLLGGFTTFSTFSLDALRMLIDGQFMHALFYMGVTLFGGLLATGLGLALVKFSL